VSNNFSAHLWLPEGRLLVGTDQGEIMLCEQSGEYKLLLPESPGEGFNIMCMRTFSKGFIIGGDQGQIMVFEKYNEPKILYTGTKLPLQSAQGANVTDEQKRNQNFLMKMLLQSKITSIDLSSSEDTILLTTDNNQIIKVNANLERLSEPDFLSYDFLIFPFHSRQVCGLDICLKKQLVATCSLDKTIKVWSHSTTNGFNLDINHEEEHQAYALAFHPSGFHLVVGFNQHISLMNIFQNTLHKYKQIEVKGCKEIQFSHGGHLFACQSSSSILVYNFYTWDKIKNNDGEFKKHSAYIRSICWLEDDSGFVSSGYDENVCLWKLNPERGESQLMYGKPFSDKSIDFTHVQVTKSDSDKFPTIYACGADKVIREIEARQDGNTIELHNKLKYEEHVQLSKLAFTSNRKYFFCGKIEKDMPGSV
jgi:WD40 repeat protein